MELVSKTYTIQWVGPMDYNKFKEYCKDEETLSPSCYNIYYFEARQDARHKWHKYVGIHKYNDGINKRLGQGHEHLGPYIKNDAKDIKIWIGSMARKVDQKPSIIDMIETLFIRAYREALDENVKKKKSVLQESICVVNLFYDEIEKANNCSKLHPMVLDDVILYRRETDSFMHGKLCNMKNK